MASGQPASAARAAAAHVIVSDLQYPELDEGDRHHLMSALRLHPGETVSVTDGKGGWRPCRFAAGGRLEVIGDAVHVARPDPPVTVGFALVKGDRPEWAVQKLTEVGVDRIAVLRTARTVVKWDVQRADRHLDRLRSAARQAVMQSRRVWMPDVSGVSGFDVASGWSGASIAEPGGAPPSLSEPTILVGPEGGWSDEELDAGLPRLDLGPGVLRTETAAVAAGLLLVALRAGVVRDARR